YPATQLVHPRYRRTHPAAPAPPPVLEEGNVTPRARTNGQKPKRREELLALIAGLGALAGIPAAIVAGRPISSVALLSLVFFGPWPCCGGLTGGGVPSSAQST